MCILSRFSRVQLFVTHQAPLSMGFPRKEHCSGLLFTPPGDLPDPGTEPCLLRVLYHVSHLEKPLTAPHTILYASVVSDSLRPHGLYSPWDSPGQNSVPSPGDLPSPGIKLGSPALQMDSLLTELSGKPPLTCTINFF